MDKETKPVYLDFNATTPFDPDVVQCISESLVTDWGNASSTHDFGLTARKALTLARQRVARMLKCSDSEVVFMSGGTEVNYAVLHTFVTDGKYRQHEEKEPIVSPRPHIITSTIEHDSVRKPLEDLAKNQQFDITFVPVNQKTHCVNVLDVVGAIQDNTILISIMMANNETGVIQPIKEICQAVTDFCLKNDRVIYVHTDAAQAIGKIPVNVADLGVDYLTIVGHKFYGPRIGALYVRNLDKGPHSRPLKPVFLGGGQEWGYRSGTENTAMIAGLGKACELVAENILAYQSHMTEIRLFLEESLYQAFGDKVAFNAKSSYSERLPNTCSISIRGEELTGRRVLNQCRKVIAGVGAACHSSAGATNCSAVLLASGVSVEDARNAIRLSVGRQTTRLDITLAVEDLVQAVRALESG